MNLNEQGPLIKLVILMLAFNTMLLQSICHRLNASIGDQEIRLLDNQSE
jgi:hypothetical protein